MAKELKGTKTHQNLKDAFAGESQANRRYLYFAKVADVEGHPDIASNFRETAEGGLARVFFLRAAHPMRRPSHVGRFEPHGGATHGPRGALQQQE